MATTILTTAASANPTPIEQELLDMVEVLTVFGKVRGVPRSCASSSPHPQAYIGRT